MRTRLWNRLNGLILILNLVGMTTAHAAKPTLIDATQKAAENQVRHLIEPILDKYCHDECKLMAINVTVDLATPDSLAPGFDEIDIQKASDLAPSSAQIKLLIDDKMGPISRGKLLDLIQQYLDTLDFPVKVNTQITHFPVPQGSEGKVAELKERVTKQFMGTVSEMLKQFCPQECLIADFNLQTETVNGEEAQYGSPGEFVQDGDTAIKIKGISATLLMDQSLSPDEQANILEMVRLKTNNFKRVEITGKSLKFPHPAPLGQGGYASGYGMGVDGKGTYKDAKTSTDSKNNSESKSTLESQSQTQMNSESKIKSDSKSNSDSKNNSISDSKNNSDSKSTTNKTESNLKQERFERTEKIERVENGDAVQAELQKFKVYGLVFACSILALLLFIALSTFYSWNSKTVIPAATTVQRVFDTLTTDPAAPAPSDKDAPLPQSEGRGGIFTRKYEIERLQEELTSVFAQQPKVAKYVFSRVLTEEGVETTSEYIHIFGEGIVVDMLRDPSLQTDLNELLEYYSKTPIELNDEKTLDLLKKLHSRTVAGKLVVLGSRSSTLFDFLSEMDALQILELIRTESITVKAIVLTQCDPQKRSLVYSQMDNNVRMQLLSELSRIDYLPRDYIFNVANALKRKRKENPKLNTEALPGSEVLVSLLERTSQNMQRTVVKSLEVSNPDSARTVMGKLVSIDTLRYLRDGQLLEVVLSLKHEELIQFLKGAPNEIRSTIFAKAPKELVIELEEELESMGTLSRDVYQAVERKIMNRMKIMANEGHINLVETNERMFTDAPPDTSFAPTQSPNSSNVISMKRAV